MKNILTNLMTSAALLFTIGGGLQAQTIRMQAAVPFAWQLNGHQMKAGDYAITSDANAHLLAIQDSKNGKGCFLLVTPASDKNPTLRLVFHRYGDVYFLAEVVAPGETVAKVSVSRAEREAMQSEQPREMATVFVDVRQVIN
jgi:hypothetical protein